MAIELWDFIDALSTGRDVEIDATEGLKSKAVSEAIYESGKSGQVVKVADVISGKVNAYQRDVDQMWGLIERMKNSSERGEKQWSVVSGQHSSVRPAPSTVGTGPRACPPHLATRCNRDRPPTPKADQDLQD